MNKKSLSLLGLTLAIGVLALQAPAEARTFYDQISNNNWGNQNGNLNNNRGGNFNRGYDRDHDGDRHHGFANNNGNSGGQCGGGRGNNWQSNNWRGNSTGNNWQSNGTAYGAPYNTGIFNNGVNPAYNNGILGNITGNKAYKIQNEITNLQQRLLNNNLSVNERISLQNKIANLNAKLTGNVNQPYTGNGILPYTGNPLSNLLPYQNNTGLVPGLTNSIGQYGYVNGIRTALGI
ncbi:MAG: hypothetical protein IPP57_11500 [Candidatus Obscuribacter sp.]|nr:hypothetical protein [Candidatus Obscuribacter sp.]MBK9771434.1 hypothetical protein [Candidatus Obscuribacter sp.]